MGNLGTGRRLYSVYSVELYTVSGILYRSSAFQHPQHRFAPAKAAMRNANARSTTPSLLCTLSIPHAERSLVWPVGWRPASNADSRSMSKLYESEFFVNWLLGTESDDNATSLGFNV